MLSEERENFCHNWQYVLWSLFTISLTLTNKKSLCSRLEGGSKTGGWPLWIKEVASATSANTE